MNTKHLIFGINSTLLYLVIILMIGTIARFYNLSGLPLGLNQDEAVNGYDAYSLLHSLRDHHGNFLPPMLQSFNDWASPALTYLTVPFVAAMGLSTYTIRFVTAFFGVISIILMFNLVRLIFKNASLGLFAALILAISPFGIHLSRWAIPPSIVPFFLLLFLNFIVYFINTESKYQKIVFGILSAFSAGALTYSYPTMKLYAPLLFLAAVIIYFKQFKYLVPSYLLFLVLVAPIYFQTLTRPEVNSRYASQSLGAVGEHIIPGSVIRFGEYFLPDFMFGFGDSNTMQQVEHFGQLPLSLVLPFYIGLIIMLYLIVNPNSDIRFSDKKLLIYLLIALGLAPIAGSLTKDHFMLLRVIQLPVLAIIISAFSYLIVREWQILHQKIIIVALIASSILSFLTFNVYYFNSYGITHQVQFHNGLESVFGYLKSNETKFDQVYFDGVTIPYIYYLFFNKIDPNSLPGKDFSSNYDKYYFYPKSGDGEVLLNIIGSDQTNLYQIKEIGPRIWKVAGM